MSEKRQEKVRYVAIYIRTFAHGRAIVMNDNNSTSFRLSNMMMSKLIKYCWKVNLIGDY